MSFSNSGCQFIRFWYFNIVVFMKPHNCIQKALQKQFFWFFKHSLPEIFLFYCVHCKWVYFLILFQNKQFQKKLLKLFYSFSAFWNHLNWPNFTLSLILNFSLCKSIVERKWMAKIFLICNIAHPEYFIFTHDISEKIIYRMTSQLLIHIIYFLNHLKQIFPQ